MKKEKWQKRNRIFIAVFLLANICGILILAMCEKTYVNNSMKGHLEDSKEKTQEVMQNYIHSFQLFAQMMSREIEEHPEPDAIWDYLKGIDSTLLEIEGDTFDGLYMYYQGRYLYSWDTPYSEYEDTGYVATERPWYKAAAAGNGEIVFTPPYMSYANHYILSTISQLQPDGETVFAYDIKMGDIQNLVTSMNLYDKEQMMIFDKQGTVIGSTDEECLGGNLYSEPEETKAVLEEAEKVLANTEDVNAAQKAKLEEQVRAAAAFHTFRTEFDRGFDKVQKNENKAVLVKLDNAHYYACLVHGEEYSFLVLVPFLSMLRETVQIWLLPLLALELLLIYVIGRIGKGQRNRELRQAYVELGQTQRRLEIALSAAQKAAAIDDLTGMMNFKSFRRGVMEHLDVMEPNESGILIMLDGDRFKTVNDNYGHQVGDEVIKLSAQMIIGRIRTVDLASRLHGDEFAIFVSRSNDYSVAKKIIQDINNTLAEESAKRNMPSITLSAGAVIARRGDSYTALAKEADEALYRAKATHNGGFASSSV